MESKLSKENVKFTKSDLEEILGGTSSTPGSPSACTTKPKPDSSSYSSGKGTDTSTPYSAVSETRTGAQESNASDNAF